MKYRLCTVPAEKRWIVLIFLLTFSVCGCDSLKKSEESQPEVTSSKLSETAPDESDTQSHAPLVERGGETLVEVITAPVADTEDEKGTLREHPEASANQAFQEQMQRARELEDSGKLADAARAYQIITNLYPSRYETYHRLALIYEKQHDIEMAHAVYEEALRLNPEDAAFYNDYGWFLFGIGYPEQSYSVLKEAVRRKPDEKKYLNNLALCQTGLKRPSDAYMTFLQVEGQNSVSAYTQLARAQIYLGFYADAEKTIQRALALDPESEQAQEVSRDLKKRKEEKLQKTDGTDNHS